MDSNRNLRIVRTSGPSYPYPYRDNVLWIYHDEDNNPVSKIWDHGKWVSFTSDGSGSGDITIDTDLNENSENPVQNKVVTNAISSINNRVASSDSLGMIKSSLVSSDGNLEVPYIHAVYKTAHSNFYKAINTILDTIYKKYNIEQFYTLVLGSSRQLIKIDSKITYDEIYSSLYNDDSKSLSKLFFLIDDSSDDVNNSLINTTELFTVTSLTDSVFTFTINYLNIVDGEKIYPNKCYVEFSFKSTTYNLAYHPICNPHIYVRNIKDGVSYNSNAIPTVSAIILGLRNKVTVVPGKQLSTNDYTNEDKAKLDEIENGANKTVVDSFLSDESENPVQNKVITSALTELQDYCFPTSLEVTVSPSSVEWTGASVQVSVGYKVLRNSKAVTADAVTISFNGETKSIENTGGGSEKFIVTSQGYKSGSVSAKKGTTIIKNSPIGISVNLYLPVYYGFSKATGKDDIVITELIKGGSSLNGTKTLTNDDATKYLWLCVPNTTSINKVTSGGFDVPFLDPVEASTTLGTYKCYRTKDLPGTDTMTIVIS